MKSTFYLTVLITTWSRIQICDAQDLAPAVFGGILPLDERTMEVLDIAAKASESAYADGFSMNLLENIVRFVSPGEDGDGELDAAVVHTTDDYCFASWQGTGANAEDWLQNRPSGTSNVTSNTNSRISCKVSTGFLEAYNNTKRTEIEAAIAECMTPFDVETTDLNTTQVITTTRQLILTGHSQGAAIALVASIVLEGYAPLVIGFAQPSALKAPCPYISPENNWRIINTIQALGTLRYDLVPYTNRVGGVAFFEDPTGPSVMLPPAFLETVNFRGESVLYESYYLENSNPSISQLSMAAHSMTNHLKKITKLRSLVGPGEFLETGGFALGSWCNDDTECITFNTNSTGGCIFGLCRNGKLGETCEWSEQCQSGRCDFKWGGVRTCQPKIEGGGGCNEDSDCASGECNWFWSCSSATPTPRARDNDE